MMPVKGQHYLVYGHMYSTENRDDLVSIKQKKYKKKKDARKDARNRAFLLNSCGYDYKISIGKVMIIKTEKEFVMQRTCVAIYSSKYYDGK